MKPRDPRGDGGGTSTRITSQLRFINIHRMEIMNIRICHMWPPKSKMPVE